MADLKTTIPAPNLPLLQRDGLLHPVWWQFFLKIYNRTGAASGDIPLPDDTPTFVESTIFDSGGLVGALIQKIAYLEDQIQSLVTQSGISDLINRIDNLEGQVTGIASGLAQQAEITSETPLVLSTSRTEETTIAINNTDYMEPTPIYYPEATQYSAGLMSIADKIKLDSL